MEFLVFGPKWPGQTILRHRFKIKRFTAEIVLIAALVLWWSTYRLLMQSLKGLQVKVVSKNWKKTWTFFKGYTQSPEVQRIVFFPHYSIRSDATWTSQFIQCYRPLQGDNHNNRTSNNPRANTDQLPEKVFVSLLLNICLVLGQYRLLAWRRRQSFLVKGENRNLETVDKFSNYAKNIFHHEHLRMSGCL